MNFYLLAFIFFSQQAIAETVYLKNGSVFKGTIIDMDQNDLTIDTGEAGRITIKRNTVQSIAEEGEAEAIKGHRDNRDDREQDQNEDEFQPKNRSWSSGIQGRFQIGQENAKIQIAGLSGGFPKSYVGIDWDLIGYRSDSWWAIYLNVSSMSATASNVEYSLGGAGLRFDFNWYKNVQGSAISLAYVGITLGSGSFSETSESSSDEQTTLTVFGSRKTLKLGYDYLWDDTWGVSCFFSINDYSLNRLSYKIEDVETDLGSVNNISISSSSLGIGFIYNFDL